MATYTRQSSFADGDTITASLFNNEFNQLVNAFNASSGHTHDGSTSGDGGPISNLFSNALVFGTNANTDVAITFNATTNDGVLTWMEDEDYFLFSDDLLIATTEKIQFRDTGLYINSSADGQLDIVADTEIQIAATTIDMNGNADISGNLGIGGNLTVTGTTTFNGGTLTLGDSAADNVVFGADVDSNIIPDDDGTYDLGSSSQEWRDLYIDGTAHIDTLDVDVNATIAGTLGVTGVLTGTSLDISGNIDVDGTTNLDVVDIDGAVDMATTLAVAGNVDFNGDLDVDGTTNLDVVDIDGAVNMATTALVTGVLTTTATQVATGGITSGSTIISDTDSTDSLGSTGVRWLKGWFDTLTAGTLTIGSGSVTDSSGAISFGDIDLTNVGTIYADQYLGDADANSGIVLPGSDVMTLHTAGSERMRILAGGNVFIGDDSFGGSGAKLAVQVPASGEGAVIRVGSTADAAETLWQFIDGADQGIGAITGNPSSNTTAYGTSSDYRLKENVSYTWDATTRLKQLKPARFNWIKQGTSTVHDGFLAHEVSAIVPSAIVGAKDAVDENDDPKYQQIDQAKLVPLLVKTIQELEARITALES